MAFAESVQRAKASVAVATTRSRAAGMVIDQRYRLLRPLGVGGMGELWVAHHQLLGRDVAIKFLRVETGTTAESLIDEAKLLASFRHPAIVSVFDCGMLNDAEPYLVMEFIEGENVGEWIERVGPRPAIEAVSLILPVARGLHAVHQRSVIHRDIKPENILRTTSDESPVKLIDFGIARPIVGASNTSLFSGTPYYMAPEQIRGERGDHRVDLWALGATLFELMVGKPPFPGDDVSAILAAVLGGSVPFPRSAVGLDGALWRTLMQCLRIEPNQRFATAEALADELSQWLAKRTDAPSAPPEIKAPVTAKTPTLDQLIQHKLSRR